MRHGYLFFRAEPDVNSGAGFTEALVAAAGGEVTDEMRAAMEEIPDRSIAGGLTEEPERGADGRFVKAEEATAAAEPEAAPAEEETPPPAEDRKGFEEGYAKALGEHSEKLGEERARREALEARLAALEESRSSEPAEPEFYVPDADGWENLSDMLDSLGGPGMMARVSTSDPSKIDAAMAIWKAGGDTDLAEAHLYEASVNRILAQAQAAQPAQTVQLPPEVTAVAQRERMNAVARVYATKNGERLAAAAPHLNAALDATPPGYRAYLGAEIASGDQERALAAYDEIVKLAEARSGQQPAPAVAPTPAGARQQAKERATVLTGSAPPVGSGQSKELPASKEEFEKLAPEKRRELASQLVARQFEKTEITSVQDGLTYGPTT